MEKEKAKLLREVKKKNLERLKFLKNKEIKTTQEYSEYYFLRDKYKRKEKK